MYVNTPGEVQRGFPEEGIFEKSLEGLKKSFSGRRRIEIGGEFQDKETHARTRTHDRTRYALEILRVHQSKHEKLREKRLEQRAPDIWVYFNLQTSSHFSWHPKTKRNI